MIPSNNSSWLGATCGVSLDAYRRGDTVPVPKHSGRASALGSRSAQVLAGTWR